MESQYSTNPRTHRKASSPGPSVSSVCSSGTFSGRRGNIRFSSAKYATSTRPRKNTPLLSFGSKKRTAARPARAKGIFESLLHALNEGIVALKTAADDMKKQLPDAEGTASSRQHYYMESEKQIKTFERKIRTLEVHRDRIEELRDEYLLKFKLRDGAFSLAQALASHTSKSAKEKLAEVRTEQKELLEDLCDIEDELETKLGAFRVHITGFTGLSRGGTWETVETQLKLASQKWKARCKINRRQQLWQDNIDIFLLGKISDELFIKVVEVKRMQGNIPIGSIKCQTREFFSFFPQTVIVTFPTAQNIKLNMDVRWSPLIGDDYINELDFRTVYCYVGAPPSGNNLLGNAACTKVVPSEDGDTAIEQSQVFTMDSHASFNTKLSNSARRHNSTPDLLLVTQQQQKKASREPVTRGLSSASQSDTNVLPGREEDEDPVAGSRSTDQLSNASSGYETGVSALRGGAAGPNTLAALLESVLSALDEPKDQYQELKSLEAQLLRLEEGLKGGRLTKAPSITLSESDALDSFDFLDTDDHDPPSKLTEGQRTSSFSDFISLRPEEPIHRLTPSQPPPPTGTSSSQGDIGFNDTQGGDGLPMAATTGMPNVDRALTQHMLHCEYLLQHLQSNGPLNRKLTMSLKRLYHETDVIRELLNIATDPDNFPKLDHLLPELAINDHLMKFWKSVAAQDNLLCVNCETFVVAMDEKYGQILWKEYPENANKVFSELLSRVLGLEGDVCDPVECKMCVTVFQFASFFLQYDDNRTIPKCLREIAQEIRITEGLRDGDADAWRRTALLLPGYPFNHGALLAAAHLLSGSDPTLHIAVASYLDKFSGNSPWRTKAIQYYVEALEHSDQAVRVGACTALGQLKANTAVQQLNYLTKYDFTSVKQAATQSLDKLGERSSATVGGKSSHFVDLDLGGRKGKVMLPRTRSAEDGLHELSDLQTRL